MHKKFASQYSSIESHCIGNPKAAGEAKILLCRIVTKPEGFKLTSRLTPAQKCLCELGFAEVTDNNIFCVDEKFLKSIKQREE